MEPWVLFLLLPVSARCSCALTTVTSDLDELTQIFQRSVDEIRTEAKAAISRLDERLRKTEHEFAAVQQQLADTLEKLSVAEHEISSLKAIVGPQTTVLDGSNISTVTGGGRAEKYNAAVLYNRRHGE